MKILYLLVGCTMIFLQLASTPAAFAKLYTWIDKNGRTQRTYYPPPAEYVQEDTPTQNDTSLHSNTTSQKVELYVTSWCPYCKKAIEFFRSKGISVEIYDIEKDEEAAARKNRLDQESGVPFAVVNGIYIHGYDPDSYSRALED